MGKKETDKETDIVDFIFKNAGPFANHTKDIGKYLKEAWNIFPDVIHGILTSLMSIVAKIYMRTRSYMALQLTRDMNYIDLDKKIWNYMYNKQKMGEFLGSLKKIKHKHKSKKSKDYLRLIYYYVNKNEKDKYLALSITQQNNAEFISVRDSIMENMNGINIDQNAIDGSDLDSIFIKSVSSMNNKSRKASKSDVKISSRRSDIRVVSVVEAHDSIRQDTERRTRLE